MRSISRFLLTSAVVVALGACTTLSEQDRALITSASQNADQAKQIAQQALAASQASQASAAKAAADAKAANEKADRIFQRGLRK